MLHAQQRKFLLPVEWQTTVELPYCDQNDVREVNGYYPSMHAYQLMGCALTLDINAPSKWAPS